MPCKLGGVCTLEMIAITRYVSSSGFIGVSTAETDCVDLQLVDVRNNIISIGMERKNLFIKYKHNELRSFIICCHVKSSKQRAALDLTNSAIFHIKINKMDKEDAHIIQAFIAL